MKNQNVFAGVDIGGTNTVIGIIDSNKKILSEKSFKTESPEGVDLFVEKLVNSINNLYAKFSKNYRLQGIGLAAPSANFLTGKIEDSANLGWKNLKLVNLMRKHFNTPLIMINDADAAALGEKVIGCAQGMKNFIVLTLGTGLGSGIVVNGEIVMGENGHAGELGHIIVKENGRKCNCGNRGCLETYVSANGIRRTAFELISYYNEETELRNINFNNLTSKKISELALKNDTVAKKVFEFTGEILGKSLSNIAAHFDPEAIILAGGLSEAEDLLLKPTRSFFNKTILNLYKGKVQILRSTLPGGRAAVFGACEFLIKHST